MIIKSPIIHLNMHSPDTFKTQNGQILIWYELAFLQLTVSIDCEDVIAMVKPILYNEGLENCIT